MATCRNGLDGLWRNCEHPQLALEHFAPFSSSTGEPGGQKQKHQEQVLNLANWGSLIADYSTALDRRITALDEFRGGFADGLTVFLMATIRGRLATGLGNASVMENGLALNHTYGLPMLAGSGLKGMASTMAHLGLEGSSWRMGTPEQDYRDQGEDHRALFGDQDTGEEGAAAGMVVFHDGWWEPEQRTSKLPFELDVLTPHQGGYNLDGKAWPNDWTDPVPSPFLTVTGSFVVPLTGPKVWVMAAKEILARAFEQIGFGAKTQIGYGRASLALHPRSVAKEVAATTSERVGRLWLVSFSNKTFELEVEGFPPIAITAKDPGNDLENWYGTGWIDLLGKAKRKRDRSTLEFLVQGGESSGRFHPTKLTKRT